MSDFWEVTPAHFLKQYIMHLKYNHPDAIQETTQNKIYYLDDTPFL